MSSTRLFVCGAAEMNGNQEYLGVERALGLIALCPLPSALCPLPSGSSSSSSALKPLQFASRRFKSITIPSSFSHSATALKTSSCSDDNGENGETTRSLAPPAVSQESQYRSLWSDRVWQKLGDQPDRWEAKSRNIQWRRRVHDVLQALLIPSG